MNRHERTAHQFLAYGAQTRAGDAAAATRVILADTKAATLESMQQAVASLEARNKRRERITRLYRAGYWVACIAGMVAMFYLASQP